MSRRVRALRPRSRPRRGKQSPGSERRAPSGGGEMAVDGLNQAEGKKKELEDAISQLARFDIRLKFIMSTKQNHVFFGDIHWWEV